MPLGAWRNNKHVTSIPWLIAGIGDGEVKEDSKSRSEYLAHVNNAAFAYEPTLILPSDLPSLPYPARKLHLNSTPNMPTDPKMQGNKRKYPSLILHSGEDGERCIHQVAGFWVICSRTGAFLRCLSVNDAGATECSIS